jgi:hypothetical protein
LTIRQLKGGLRAHRVFCENVRCGREILMGELYFFRHGCPISPSRTLCSDCYVDAHGQKILVSNESVSSTLRLLGKKVLEVAQH